MPLDPIQCLSQIIGLSPSDCPCEGTAPENNTGMSGYYITTDGGIPIQFAGAISDCQKGGAWDILQSARTAGARKMWVDLMREFAKRNKPMYSKYVGAIGKTENASAITSTKRRAVWRIESTNLPAYAKVKGAWMYSTVGGSLDFDFYQSTDTATAIASKELTLAAGKYAYTAFDEPVLLDLYGTQHYEGPIYYATWEIPDGDYARKNRFYCCNRQTGYNGFFALDSWLVDNITDMETSAAKSQNSVGLGLVLDIELSCTMTPFFCNLSFDVSDFNGYDWQVAEALKEAAVISLATEFLNSQNINFMTVYSMEAIDRIKVETEKKYMDRIKYLGGSLPGGAERCYQCGNGLLEVETILV